MIRPPVGSWNRGSRSASVVFPAPDGPTSATTLPFGSVKDTSLSTGIALAVAEVDRRRRPLPARTAPSPSPGRSTSTLGSSSISNTRSALASVTAITAGYELMVLSGEVSLSAAIRKTMIVSGASGAPRPMSAGPGAGPDDQDHQEAGEDLGQRAGERREALGPDHLLPVARGLGGEAGALARLLAVRRGSAGRRRSAR